MSLVISVIIVSYNRKPFLEKTLQYCFEQTVSVKEVIVVDASEDKLQLDADFTKVYGERLVYIKWGEIGNISKQRNEGIRRASGDLIMFLDDDVSFEKNFFNSVIESFEKYNADAITGLIQCSHREVSKRVHVFEEDTLHYLGQPSFHQCDFLVETYLVSAACLAIKREVLLKVGGFDEQLKGVFDDSDLGVRLMKSGHFVLHDNKVTLYHYAAKNSGSRSPLLGLKWKYANICYMQIKHFYNDNSKLFFNRVVMSMLKPSRAWLSPLTRIKHIKAFVSGYHESLDRISTGPIYLNDKNHAS